MKIKTAVSLLLSTIMMLSVFSVNLNAADLTPQLTIRLTPGEAAESEAVTERPGTGFVDALAVGEIDPEKSVVINRRTREIRRIVKQDVYGRELPDWFYFYRNMLNASEQRLYDQIYANAVELDPYFEISSMVHFDRVTDIFISVRYDNPDLFWLDTEFYYTYDSNGYITSMTLTFFDFANNIEPWKDAFYKAADSVLEHVMHFENDIEKIKYVHDLLTNLNTYNLNSMYNQSAYSALCLGQTVCAGFTFAFQYLMQRLGIPCASVYGDAWWLPGPEYAGRHIWNLVYLDGQYYEMDVTWNNHDVYPDSSPHNYSYSYFNVQSSALTSTHTRLSPSTGLPAAYGTIYSYPNYFGDNPGSDFTMISYANPSRTLPFIYPDAEYAALPVTYVYDETEETWQAYDNDEAWDGSREHRDYDENYEYWGDDFWNDAYGCENEYDECWCYDVHDVLFDWAGYGWDYDDVDEWVRLTCDDCWYELWDWLEWIFDDDIDILDDMDWEEFIEFLLWWINS